MGYFRMKIRSFLYLFITLEGIWLLATSSLNSQELVIGTVVALILSFIFNKYYLDLGFPPFTLKRLFYIVIYKIFLLWEIIKANLDVAQRVLSPSLPIKPGIVIIKTELKSDLAKFILANSITLTPGTFTLDILEDKLLIHWIDVKAEDINEATQKISQKFENILKKIFE